MIYSVNDQLRIVLKNVGRHWHRKDGMASCRQETLDGQLILISFIDGVQSQARLHLKIVVYKMKQKKKGMKMSLQSLNHNLSGTKP